MSGTRHYSSSRADSSYPEKKPSTQTSRSDHTAGNSSSSFHSAKSRHFTEVEITDPSVPTIHSSTPPNSVVPLESHPCRNEKISCKLKYYYDNYAAMLEDDTLLNSLQNNKRSALHRFLQQNAQNIDTNRINIPIDLNRTAFSQPAVDVATNGTTIDTSNVDSSVDSLENYEKPHRCNSPHDTATMSTLPSANSLGSSYGKDSTLLLERSISNATSVSLSEDNVAKPEPFSSSNHSNQSIATYRNIVHNGFPAGKYILVTIVIVTFILTMFIIVILLILGSQSPKVNSVRFNIFKCLNLSSNEHFLKNYTFFPNYITGIENDSSKFDLQ